MSDDNQNTDISADSQKEEEKEKEEVYQPLHLKTKSAPAVIMLLGGLAVTVDVFIQELPFQRALFIIFVSLVGFLIIGELVKMALDRIELPNPESVDEDGNVIEKGKSGEASDQDAQEGSYSTPQANEEEQK